MINKSDKKMMKNKLFSGPIKSNLLITSPSMKRFKLFVDSLNLGHQTCDNQKSPKSAPPIIDTIDIINIVKTTSGTTNIESENIMNTPTSCPGTPSYNNQPTSRNKKKHSTKCCIDNNHVEPTPPNKYRNISSHNTEPNQTTTDGSNNVDKLNDANQNDPSIYNTNGSISNKSTEQQVLSDSSHATKNQSNCGNKNQKNERKSIYAQQKNQDIVPNETRPRSKSEQSQCDLQDANMMMFEMCMDRTNKQLHNDFIEFCQKNRCLENIQFLEICHDIRMIKNKKEQKDRAMRCYDKYISCDSQEQINISSKAREKIIIALDISEISQNNDANEFPLIDIINCTINTQEADNEEYGDDLCLDISRSYVSKTCVDVGVDIDIDIVSINRNDDEQEIEHLNKIFMYACLEIIKLTKNSAIPRFFAQYGK